jgi:catechol 2,3-dioxygenase-like lactoylglutathione lyase family enzyme
LAAPKAANGTFNVGGVALDQPFKIRRLGHFGINTQDQAAVVEFFTDLLGYKFTDLMDPFKGQPNPPEFADLGDCKRYFLRYGSDHHALALYNHRHRIATDPDGKRFWPGNTINQITWQVGSLEQVVTGHQWLEESGCDMVRAGRDMPGSNWHTYLMDPDGHINELYYGIEQIGWDGYSKPWDMFDRAFHEIPELPQMCEYKEVNDALARGIKLTSGYRYDEEHLPFDYAVEGVQMPRPFKVVKIGPLGLFVQDLSASLDFYVRLLGFIITEETTCEGERVVFLRNNTEHHSLVLAPIALRAKLGLSEHSSTMTFAQQLASYSQLRAAIAFFEEKGFTLRELPPEMTPGMDHNIFVIDPDGHAIQLYYHMEQVGWDGKPRPAAKRRKVEQGNWPETLDALSDTYTGEPFLGPWN